MLSPCSLGKPIGVTHEGSTSTWITYRHKIVTLATAFISSWWHGTCPARISSKVTKDWQPHFFGCLADFRVRSSQGPKHSHCRLCKKNVLLSVQAWRTSSQDLQRELMGQKDRTRQGYCIGYLLVVGSGVPPQTSSIRSRALFERRAA